MKICQKGNWYENLSNQYTEVDDFYQQSKIVLVKQHYFSASEADFWIPSD